MFIFTKDQDSQYVQHCCLRSKSHFILAAVIGLFGLEQGEANATPITFGCDGAQTCTLDQLIGGGGFIAGSTVFNNWSFANLPFPSGLIVPLKTSEIMINPVEVSLGGGFGLSGFDIIPGTVNTPCGDMGALQSFAGDCNFTTISHSRISFDLIPRNNVRITNALFSVDFGYINDTNIIENTFASLGETISNMTGTLLSESSLTCDTRKDDSLLRECIDKTLNSTLPIFPELDKYKVRIEETITVSGGRQTGNTAEIKAAHMRYIEQSIPEPSTLYLLGVAIYPLLVLTRHRELNR